ncbi:MAG: CHAT domain-containing protein, partial [Magnetococcales bacterium]|nr:CHAT domain-containing protein [Magnetococcales bacterium]
MKLIFALDGDFLRFGDQSRRLTEVDFTSWRGWTERYEAVLLTKSWPELLPLGQEMFRWLDGSSQWLAPLTRGFGEWVFEFHTLVPLSDRARLFHAIPWEILAQESFLAEGKRLFIPLRRLTGAAEPPAPPRYRDLSLLFMAAAPETQKVLDFEAEEAGILEATQGLDLNLFVEESGSLEPLRKRLGRMELPEILHLSCHGDIEDGKGLLILEDEAGWPQKVQAKELVDKLAPHLPPLLFLSACRTAENRHQALPLALEMVEANVCNVLGWDGSVRDRDAIAFAQVFYGHLAGNKPVAQAAALARAALLEQHRREADMVHWHLARVYVGPHGGGSLCNIHGKRHPQQQEDGYREFLDLGKKVPVASRDEFVGRRRQIQRVIHAARQRSHWGVVLHGMGNRGKSSLAARVANRLTGHRRAVIYDDYSVMAIFHAVLAGLPGKKKVPSLRQRWQSAIHQGGAVALQDFLESLLQKASSPILLILDDLERTLQPPGENPDQTLCLPQHVETLQAVLQAFQNQAKQGGHLLLLTSRYRFVLPDRRGRNLAEALLAVELPPMNETERRKQWRAQLRQSGSSRAEALRERILKAANGNPGLQNLLTGVVHRGAFEEAEKAVAAVEHYLLTGAIPQDRDAGEFFRRVALDALKGALNAEQSRALRNLFLFARPQPEAVLLKVIAAANPKAILSRFIDLGLVDGYWHAWKKRLHYLPDALLHPLFNPLSETEQTALSRQSIEEVGRCWQEDEGHLPRSEESLEIYRLAQLAEHASVMAAAAEWGGFWLKREQYEAKEALKMVTRAVDALDRQGLSPRADLLRLGGECAMALGEAQQGDAFLQRGLALPGADPVDQAQLWFEWAARLMGRGELKEAENWLQKAEEVFLKAGEVRSRAVTLGQIADILQARGQL